jgi:hypothetical protein
MPAPDRVAASVSEWRLWDPLRGISKPMMELLQQNRGRFCQIFARPDFFCHSEQSEESRSTMQAYNRWILRFTADEPLRFVILNEVKDPS